MIYFFKLNFFGLLFHNLQTIINTICSNLNFYDIKKYKLALFFEIRPDNVLTSKISSIFITTIRTLTPVKSSSMALINFENDDTMSRDFRDLLADRKSQQYSDEEFKLNTESDHIETVFEDAVGVL